jgi:hypothetical protein
LNCKKRMEESVHNTSNPLLARANTKSRRWDEFKIDRFGFPALSRGRIVHGLHSAKGFHPSTWYSVQNNSILSNKISLFFELHNAVAAIKAI